MPTDPPPLIRCVFFHPCGLPFERPFTLRGLEPDLKTLIDILRLRLERHSQN